MNNYYYSLLLVFGVVLYMISVDENVGKWIWIQFQTIRINVVRYYYIITLGLRLKYDGWQIKRRLARIKRENSN